MTAGSTSSRAKPSDDTPPLMLGGYAALAESEWMGVAQASDVLEPLHISAPSRRWAIIPRLPRLRLSGLLTREFTIAEASFVLMASFFFSALLGAVRQVLFNAQFGAGLEASAFYAAFRLPDTLFSLIAGGALSSAMIPVLLSASREEGENAAWRLTNLVLTTLLAVFALVVLVAEIFTPALVNNVLAPGFDAETSELTVTLTRIILVQPLILAVGSVAAAVLNSRNQFLLTALSTISHNVTLIAGVLAAWAYPNLGIYGPTLGVVAGAALQVAIMLPGLLGRNFRYRPAWNLKDRRLGEVIRLLIPNGLSVGVGYAGLILDTAFASKAPEMEALPAIYNAWMLVGLPIALLGQAVGQAAFPRLAAHVAALEWSRMRRTLLQALGAAVALAIPALLGLILMVRLSREQFKLSWTDSLRGAYHILRATIAWAPPRNRPEEAHRYLRRFYTLVARERGLAFAPDHVAALELRYWQLHRDLVGVPDKLPLVEALAELHAAIFHRSTEEMLPSATYRARATEIVDTITGRRSPDPAGDWRRVEENLLLAYQHMVERYESV